MHYGTFTRLVLLLFVRNDHTLGNALGSYLFIEASKPAKTGDNAILESTLLFATPSFGTCMEFWYNMNGRDTGTLAVYLNVTESRSLKWQRSGNKGEEWHNAQLSLRSSRSFRVQIEAIRGTDYRSDIAIDDIDFIDKECIADVAGDIEPVATTPTPALVATTTPSTPQATKSADDCDFEQDMCIWKASGKIAWLRGRGQKGADAGTIDFDHTLGANGWYLYARASGNERSDFGRIESAHDFAGSHCLEFYYYFVSDVAFAFNVFVEQDEKREPPLWRRSSSQGNFWKLGRLTVHSNELDAYKFVMQLGDLVDNDLESKFGLDDIRFTNTGGACVDGSALNQVCTFTKGNKCGYIIDESSPMSWLVYDPDVANASTPLAVNDHTTEAYGSGYVYVGTADFKFNDTALMTSPPYPAMTSTAKDAERCLEFYFYLEGNDSVALNVRLDEPQVLVWSRDYEHSTFWWKADIGLKYTSSYRVIYEAVVTGQDNSSSWAALDDIVLKDGPCSSMADLCDFENRDFCNWRNDLSSHLFWKLNSGPTKSADTGPESDHTLFSSNGYFYFVVVVVIYTRISFHIFIFAFTDVLGYYIYMEAAYSIAKEGMTAKLISEPFEEKAKGCLYFWYFMYGKVNALQCFQRCSY